MPSRRLTFHQEIREAITARERLVLVVGPRCALSDYVRQEWPFALLDDKVVTPVLRLGDYPLVPDELRLLHTEDFRDDARFDFHLDAAPFREMNRSVLRMPSASWNSGLCRPSSGRYATHPARRTDTAPGFFIGAPDRCVRAYSRRCSRYSTACPLKATTN